MSLLTATILGLNPEIEKYNYLHTVNTDIECVINATKDIDLKDTYLLFNCDYSSKLELIKNQLNLFFTNSDEDIKINSKVYNSSYYIINNLYPSIYNEININDIYTSNYGTLIIDWEKKSGDVFSLEIGSEKLGYFIEKDNIDIKQMEEIEIEGSLKELLTDLSSFLNN